MAHRRSLPTIVLLLLAGLSLEGGCKKNSSPVAPPGGDNQTGSPVSNAARKAAFDAVDTVFKAVDWTNPHTAKATLLQVLRSRPEFEESDTNEDASLWGRFTDDRLLIIANNRHGGGKAAPPVPPHRLPDIPPIAGGELPTSKKASILNAMGTWFTDTPVFLTPMLEAKGYDVSNLSPTVDNLAAINGDALFYLNGHGGKGRLRDRTRLYAVWTATPFDTTADELYKAMWANHEIAYMKGTADEIPVSPPRATVETRFAITKFFVLARMTFGKNSLVYIDACSSLNQDFGDACLASSRFTAGYAGWSFSSEDEAASKTACFVIDRLLGTNMDPYHGEDPPQRPFRYPEILTELAAKGLNTITWPDEPGSEFLILPSTAEFGMLAPSIEHMTVDERNKRLTILGDFGSDGSSASVTINDQPMPITHWSIGEIWCTLPSSGPNTSGDVKVIVHGDSSNTVRLTEWKGEVQAMATFPGSIGYTVTYSFHVRGDVHSFRTAPGGVPKPDILEPADGMPDCFAVVAASGSTTDVVSLPGGCTQSLHESWPSSRDSVTITSKGSKTMGVGGELRPADKILRLFVGMGSTNFLTDVFAETLFCPNSPPGGGQFTTPITFGDNDTLDIPFDASFNLLAPTLATHKTATLEIYGLDPNFAYGTITASFAGAPAIHPPDPKAGQRPIRRGNGISANRTIHRSGSRGTRHE